MSNDIETIQKPANDLEFILAGKKLDMRTLQAKHFKEINNDLMLQLGNMVSPSEKTMLRNAAALTMLCEMDMAALLEGTDFDQEGYRKNVAALRGALIALGLAKKSRDITKADQNRFFDNHTQAILDAD